MAGILSKLFGGTGQRQVETRYTPIPGSISPEYDKMRIKEIEKLEKQYEEMSALRKTESGGNEVDKGAV